MRRALAAIVVASAALGCSERVNPNAPLTTACRATFSGGARGTIGGCFVLTNARAGQWSVTIGGVPDGNVAALSSAGFILAGAPRRGSFTFADADVLAADVSFTLDDATSFAATKGPGARAAVGSGTLAITAIANLDIAGNNLYRIAGSFDAMLVKGAASGGTPTAELNATF
jgi:hypothetical protein